MRVFLEFLKILLYLTKNVSFVSFRLHWTFLIISKFFYITPKLICRRFVGRWKTKISFCNFSEQCLCSPPDTWISGQPSLLKVLGELTWGKTSPGHFKWPVSVALVGHSTTYGSCSFSGIEPEVSHDPS